MASASFRSVGHVRPALWPSGCYCKHKGTEASAFYAKRSGFLRFRIAVLVPILSRCPPVRHIGHCTHWAGTHFLESDSRPLLRSCACSIVPAHRPSHWREGAHKRTLAARPVVTGWIFGESNAFFQKHIGAVSEGPCSFVPQVYGGGPQK